MDFRLQQEVGNPDFTCRNMHRPGYKQLVCLSVTLTFSAVTAFHILEFSSAYIHINTALLRQEYTYADGSQFILLNPNFANYSDTFLFLSLHRAFCKR
jgi:hypothetical protein